MSAIQPLEKNIRNCEKCMFAYVINGDESNYMCQIPHYKDGEVMKPEGICMYCKRAKKSDGK